MYLKTLKHSVGCLIFFFKFNSAIDYTNSLSLPRFASLSLTLLFSLPMESIPLSQCISVNVSVICGVKWFQFTFADRILFTVVCANFPLLFPTTPLPPFSPPSKFCSLLFLISRFVFNFSLYHFFIFVLVFILVFFELFS